MDRNNPISNIKTSIIRYFANIDYDFIILFIIICPFFSYFLIYIREQIDEAKRIKLLNTSIASAILSFTLFFVAFGSLLGVRNSIRSSQPSASIQSTAEITTTKAPRTTTTIQTSESTTITTTSEPVAGTPESTISTTTTTEPATTTTRSTTQAPTQPVYTDPPPVQTQTQIVYKDYLYNSNSGIFHSSSCRTIPDNMGSHWIAYNSTTSDYMRSLGYKPCGTCKP